MDEEAQDIRALDAVNRPVFYSFRRCPYAMRARLAVFSTGLETEYREVVLRSKPAHMLDISPKGTVPVLQLPDGRVLEESLDIMKWAFEHTMPGDFAQLDEDSIIKCETLIARNDGEFKHHLDRYKYPNRYEGVKAEEEREKALVFLRALNSSLTDQDFLFGPQTSFADIAIFPFVRQFANVDRDWFDALDLKSLQAWLDRNLTSKRFESIMEKQKAWSPENNKTLFPGRACPFEVIS